VRNGVEAAGLRYQDDDRLYDEATKVTAEDGEVILDGPDGRTGHKDLRHGRQ
jgi:hypothetical protein